MIRAGRFRARHSGPDLPLQQGTLGARGTKTGPAGDRATEWRIRLSLAQEPCRTWWQARPCRARKLRSERGKPRRPGQATPAPPLRVEQQRLRHPHLMLGLLSQSDSSRFAADSPGSFHRSSTSPDAILSPRRLTGIPVRSKRNSGREVHRGAASTGAHRKPYPAFGSCDNIGRGAYFRIPEAQEETRSSANSIPLLRMQL